MTTRSLPVADVPDGRSLRRDAVRNRLRIIKAAQEVFAVQGLGAGMNDIAHHAGVGVGTVYRRFPDKDALIAAALHDQVGLMLGVAEEAVAADRAWDGLLFLLDHALALLATNIGLRDVALGVGTDEERRTQAQRFRPYVETLLERAEAEGDLRPGVTVEDLLVVQLMVSELARHSVNVRPAAWRRYLGLLTDGLRARPDVGRLTEPLDESAGDEIARHWIDAR